MSFRPLPKKNTYKKTRLPATFNPGQVSVICGRGKVCFNSPGNRCLKSLVQENLEGYSQADNKVAKSVIVSKIIHEVKKRAEPEAAFVKNEEGVWWEVEDAFAREKIGCMFRDTLHTQYRSSTKAKQARKRQRKQKMQVTSQAAVVSLESSTVNDMSRTSSLSSLSDIFKNPTLPKVASISTAPLESLDAIFLKETKSTGCSKTRGQGKMFSSGCVGYPSLQNFSRPNFFSSVPAVTTQDNNMSRHQSRSSPKNNYQEKVRNSIQLIDAAFECVKNDNFQNLNVGHSINLPVSMEYSDSNNFENQQFLGNESFVDDFPDDISALSLNEDEIPLFAL